MARLLNYCIQRGFAPDAHRTPDIRGTIAFVAFLFSALVLGPGNALFATAKHDSHHAHHGTLSGSDHATTPAWIVPAHCVFCIDGIAPQPTALVVIGEKPALPAPVMFDAAQESMLLILRRASRPQSRAPPSFEA